jgi:hypothetical protein
MAKRITIEKTGLLESLNDPWGGINNNDFVIIPYSDRGATTEVPPGAEWGVTKEDIENLVKTLFGTKVGDFRWYLPSGENYYKQLLFATKADAEMWDADHTLTNYINSLTLPIAATSTDSYSLTLSTSRTGSTAANPIVVPRGDSFIVPLKVLAWHYPPNGAGDAVNFDRLPQITVRRAAIGSDQWSDPVSVNVTGIASSLDDTTYPNLVDIKDVADIEGDMMLQFAIPSYVYTNAQGETATMASNRVVVYVRAVTLGISMDTSQWISPKNIGENDRFVQVKLNLTGGIAKTLHVKFTDALGNWTYGAPVGDVDEGVTSVVSAIGEYNYTISDDAGTLGVTTSGVHTIEAWLTYGSGADMITTPHIVHQLLVLKPSTASTVGPKVLLQQVARTVDNFVQSTLCHYWVWNPILSEGIYINNVTENVSVRFVVANTDNLSESHVEYMTMPVSVTPGTDCTLLATMEIETATPYDTYNVNLHALSSAGAAMLSPSQGFIVDNTSGFQPIAGRVFHINPKMRDNGEATPKSIINTLPSGDTQVASVWSDTFKMDGSDGWVTDSNGEKVLRVPAGRMVTILFNPFNYFYTAPSYGKAMTICFDFQVNNITNEDDPVLQLCEQIIGAAGRYLGLRLRPLIGTMGSVTANDEAITDFRWSEGRRQHLTITITPDVRPNADGTARWHSGALPEGADVNGTINLVRIYINGNIQREIRYTPNRISDNHGIEFCNGELSNGGIKIGQIGTEGRASGCDIDIYDISVWEDGLAPKSVFQNRVSSLPSSTKKRALKARNDIFDETSGRISLRKTTGNGITSQIWHGDEPMIGDDSKTGWLEIRRYDYGGAYMPRHSGSFCKTTKVLKGKGQGTTAMTYFYWNIQWKFGDVGYDKNGRVDPGQCIVLTPDQIYSNIHLVTVKAMSELSENDQALFANVDTEVYTHVCGVYGGNLGKNEPVGTSTKWYPCTVDDNDNVVTIMLPDGWVDDTGDLYNAVTNPTGGYYRGQCWQAGPGLPYGSKHVLKINYASSMQSHLIGVNWLYNALHTLYCGTNSLQSIVSSAVVAKQVVPVMFFTAGTNITDNTQTNSSAIFRGLGGFGPGKMDKPSWGYVKSSHPYFAMFEGAVNNSILSDQLAPWDDTDHFDAQGNVIQRAKVKYWLHDPSGTGKDPESFYYRKTVLNNGAETDSWEKGISFDGGKTGRSTVANPTTDEERFNNLLANINSCDDPSEAPSATITAILRNAWNYVYLHSPNIKYYQGTLAQLEAAVDTMTDEQKKRKYITSDNNYNLIRWDFCERRFVNAGLWNPDTHQYNPINIFEAIGSPTSLANNRSKVVENYIALLVNEARPSNVDETDGIGAFFKAKSLRFHYAFQNHFIAGTDNCSKNTYYVIDPVTHLIELHQDDVDTVLPTDNFGYQTKPYYIDRMHPYSGVINMEYISGTGTSIIVTRGNNTLLAGDSIVITSNQKARASIVAATATTANVNGTDQNVWELTLSNGLGTLTGGTMLSVDKALRTTDMVIDTDASGYDGMLNSLFDLTEEMWAKNGNYTIASALNSILRFMSTLIGGIGSDESNEMSGVWQVLNKYLFDIQRYFPTVAYNETARIRYEFPAMLGFVGRNGEADPLAQSMGDQLEAEIQFMHRRLIYMASYAGFGEFSNSQNQTDSTGISGTSTTLAVNSIALPNGGVPNSTFTVTPHQYMFPVFSQQQNTYATHRRTAPGEEATFENIGNFVPGYPVELRGLNYYRSVGNIGDKTVNATNFSIQGIRLVEFIAEPTMYYPTAGGEGITKAAYDGLSDIQKANYAPAFRVDAGLQIDNFNGATRLRSISLNGCSTTGSTALIPFDLTRLTLVESIDLRNTAMQAVTIPQTATLTSLQLPAGMTTIALRNCPSLNTLSIQGYASLTSLTVKDCPLLSSSTLGIVNSLKTAGSAMTYIDINNVSWQSPFTLNGDTMRWLLDIETCKLAGRIKMAPTSSTPSGRLYFDDVARLIKRYGNIYDSNITVDGNGLYVDFAQTPMTVASMSITGQKYINPADLRDKGYTGNTVTSGYYDDLALNVSTESNCNNPAAIQRNGVWMPDVKWTIETADMDSFARIEDEYSSSIHIVQIYELTIEIKVTVRDYNGNDRSVRKTIGLWRRIPQVGDYAWTDGEFDNENDTSKKLAGMVVMRQMLDENDNVTTNQAECVKYKLWVYGVANSTMPANSNTDRYGSSSGVGGVTTTCWGLYPANNANGFVDTKTDGTTYDEELLEQIRQTVRGKSYNGHAFNSSNDIFDTPLSYYSSSDVTLRKNAAAVTAAGGGIPMQVDEGDGWAKTYVLNGQTTNLPSHLTNFNTEDENATLLAYADDVLTAILTHFGIMDRTHLDSDDYWDESGNVHPKTRQALADLMQIVVMYCARAYMCDVFSSSSSTNYAVGKHVTYNGGYYTCIQPTTGGTFEENCWEPFEISDINMTGSDFTNVNPGRFREFLFPAARLADVWCPADASVNSGLTEEQLDEQYMRGKWMLPSSGLLARIFNFLGNSRQNYNGATSGSYDPVASQANEGEETKEAMLALFSNAMERGRSVSVSSSSLHWSSTEYSRGSARSVYFTGGNANNYNKNNGVVVRPVAAFEFVP